MWDVLAGIGLIGGVAVGGFGVGWNARNTWLARNDKRFVRKQRLEKVYAPLRALLLETHITTCTAIRYPFFTHRVKRAWGLLGWKSIPAASRAIFDKGCTEETGEVEHGRPLSLEKIEALVSANVSVTGSKLPHLVQAAVRERIELRDFASFANHDRPVMDNSLSRQELDLVDHIFTQYDKLSREFGGR